MARREVLAVYIGLASGCGLCAGVVVLVLGASMLTAGAVPSWIPRDGDFVAALAAVGALYMLSLVYGGSGGADE